MLSYRKFYYNLKILADLSLVALSFIISSFLVKQRIGRFPHIFKLEAQDILLLLILCLVWHFSSRATGLYDEFRSRTLTFELITVIKNCLIQTVISALFLFVFKGPNLSRFFLVALFLVQWSLLTSWKLALRIFLGLLRKKGRNLRSILIVGAGEVGQEFYKAIISYPHLGFFVIGFLDDQLKLDLGELYLGSIDDLERVLSQKSVDEIVIALPNYAVDRIDTVVSISEKYPARLRIIPDYFKFFSPHFKVSIFAHFPIISLRANPLEEFHFRFLKRSFDIILSLLLFALVFWWLWPVLAIGVKFSSPGPVFFRQERWGKKNKRIICYKFRSMRKDSRDVDENGEYQQASKNDPRITKFGVFLRRTDLDELPQFLNVLKGEMSIVGPRPHPTPLNLEAKENVRHYMLRHLVKPGITGWAQVNGYRGPTKDHSLMQKRVDYDLWYIENWTFWLDIQIFLITLMQMLKGDPNAY
jgi:putative colanic acid biosynthesis UDP-glucose lipid carrier transferase